jgi:hypothetical protein
MFVWQTLEGIQPYSISSNSFFDLSSSPYKYSFYHFINTLVKKFVKGVGGNGRLA